MYGPGLAVNDFSLGIYYMLAVSSLATYGILLAGWSANSKYAFLGSLRSTAQLISYELVLSSAILLVIMLTGNLNLTVNTESQRAIWYVLPLLPIFIIFFIGSVAETNRAPFDLAEASLNYHIVLAYYYITTVFISITRLIIINYIYNITIIMNIYNNFSTLRTFYKLHYAAGKVNFKTFIKLYSSLTLKDSSLHPEWITGFTDGEGSFGIKIYKAKGYKLGWRLEPFFQIKLNARDIDILYRIKEYFGGVGTISFEKNTAKYIIRKLSDIVDILIPHFEAYPLLTKKFADFELFRQIILIIKNESSLSEQGFIKILNLRYYLNNGISEELKELYPNLVPVMRPEVPERKIQPEWLVGFIDGEGSFNIITVEKKSSDAPSMPNTSYKVWLHFQITQHSRDTVLMERIVTFFDCGSVKKRNTDAVDFKLNKFELLENIIIPFFQKYPLQSAKVLDFLSFVEAMNVIKSKKTRQWTAEQFDKIKNIQSNMNKYIKENKNEKQDDESNKGK